MTTSFEGSIAYTAAGNDATKLVIQNGYLFHYGGKLVLVVSAHIFNSALR